MSGALWAVVGCVITAALVAVVQWWRKPGRDPVTSAVRAMAEQNAKLAEAARVQREKEADTRAKAKAKRARKEVNEHANSGSNFVDDPPFGNRSR